MLRLIDEGTETDLNRRSLNYFMLISLGARACREAYVTRRPRSNMPPTTEAIFGLPVHTFYMQLLGKTVDYYQAAQDGDIEGSNPTIRSIYSAFYSFVRRAVKPVRGKAVTSQQFFAGLIDTMVARQQFFDEERPLSTEERIDLMIYDKAARTITEKAFRESVKPFSQTGLHLPERPQPYLYPELVVGFCDPAYWNNHDTTMTNRQRSSFSDKVFAGWAASEHYYWNDRLETGDLEEVSRQVQELEHARH